MNRDASLLLSSLLLLSCQELAPIDSGADSAPAGPVAETGLPADTALPNGTDLPPGTGVGWFAEVSQRIATDARSFRELEPGRFAADVRGHRAELGPDGLLATNRAGDGELLLRFSAWGREGRVEPVAPGSPLLGDCASPVQVLPDGSCLRRIELAHRGLTELWQTDSDGIEQSWEIAQPPAGQGLLLLHVDVEQAIHWQLDGDALGAQLLDSSGSAWRYAGLHAWDARGEPLAAAMETTATGLLIVLDDAGALYPITVDPTLTEDTKLTASDGASDDIFGFSVSGAGDVNDDGYDDVIVGAYQDDDNGAGSGSAYVYLGGSGGIDSTSETKLIASAGASGDGFARSVSGAGDVDGDGYDDVIVGAPEDGISAGCAYLYLGSSGGIDSSTETKLVASDTASNNFFGYAVSGAGDVDDDGYDDVLVWAPYDAAGYTAGSVYVYLGSSGGIDNTRETKLTASDDASSDNFGVSISGAGDVDGDGYDDIIVGAFADDDNGSASGSVYLYLGSSGGIDSTSETKLTASDGAKYDYFGYSVSGAGDLDGDGYDDVIVGAYGDDGYSGSSSEAGSVYVYQGSSGGVDSSSETKLTASDAASGDRFGYSVSGAGDVDGDGYDDVILGAYSDDDDGSSSGSAYVYLGSASSIDSLSETKLTAPDAASGDYFGYSVSGAGDVNGDGYDDVIVGAYNDDDDGSSSGSAYTVLGSCPTPATWYADADSDGYGDASATTTACSMPTGYVADATDCDDTEPLAWPSASEVCDGVDNDCDGTVDNDDAVDATTWYADVDGDGYGGYAYRVTACTVPSGYVDNSNDCDDTEALAWRGAAEVCDGADNDCDGTVDNDDATDATTWYADADADGYGDVGTTTTACSMPSGFVANATDCDDTEALAWRGAAEVCDGADNDCDGTVDNNDAVDATTWYADKDTDGYGDASVATTACSMPTGYVADANDCDDTEALAWRGAAEVCDGADNDCDGTVDNDDATDATTWYADSDTDGYGDASANTTACSMPSGYVANATDCDDTEALAWTGASEVCDGVDNDCDGTVDNDDAVDATTWYADVDDDGYGGSAYSVTACTVPSGYVDNSDDCDDTEPLAWTGASEVCDGADNDCDGTVDNDDADGTSTWHADTDGDGFTDADSSTTACEPPSGYADASAEPDCDDEDASVNPGAVEVAGDGIDQDCDGADTEPASEPGEDAGCGCASSGNPAHGVALLLLGVIAVVRRRSPGSSPLWGVPLARTTRPSRGPIL